MTLRPRSPWRAGLSAALILFTPTLAAHGQEREAPSAQTTTQATTQPASRDRAMTVSPARAADADLRTGKDLFDYSQDTLRLRPENAATLYLQAFASMPPRNPENDASINTVLDTTVDQLDVAVARKALEPYQQAFTLAEPAIRRTSCAWGAPLEEQGIETLLPYLSQARTLAQVMRIQARIHAAEGNRQAADEMIRRMYVLGMQTGNAEQPVLIDGLVGIAIAHLATDIVTELATRPDAPNQYWALTALPTPMFDMNRWLWAERTFLIASLPALREPETMNEQRWAETMGRLRGYVATGEDTGIVQVLRDATLSASLAVHAEQFFKDRGMTDEQIKAMGLYPMLARYLVEDYQATFDDMAKLMHLPFPDADPRLADLEQKLAARTDGGPGVLARLLLPSMRRANAAPYRLERQIAAMRIVEAVRDHAADHDGRPPASLDVVRLPIPEDPMTGEAFGYTVEGRVFTITARRYQENDINSGFAWRVTLRPVR